MKKYLSFITLLLIISCSMEKTNMLKNGENDGTLNHLRIHDIWTLEKIGKRAFESKETNQRPVIEIHVNDMKLYGNDSCNEIFGKVEVLDDTTLKIGNISGTKKGCADMETPKQFRTALQATTRYKIVNLKLYLLDTKGKEILTFRKVD